MLFRQFWKATNLARFDAGLPALDLDTALAAHREYTKVDPRDPDAKLWEAQAEKRLAGVFRVTT